MLGRTGGVVYGSPLYGRNQLGEGRGARHTVCGETVAALISHHGIVNGGAEAAIHSQRGVVVPEVEQALQSAHILTGVALGQIRPGRSCCHNSSLLSFLFQSRCHPSRAV